MAKKIDALTPTELMQLREELAEEFDPGEFDLNVGLFYRQTCIRLLKTLDATLQTDEAVADAKASSHGRYLMHDVSEPDGYDGLGLTCDFVSCKLDTKGKDTVRIELHYDEDRNCAMVRSPAGRLTFQPVAGNEARVLIKTHWDDPKL